MFEAQGFVELGGEGHHPGLAVGGDPKHLWLSGDANSAASSPTRLPGGGGGASNVDRVLFNDLVEIVPLVQSLIVLSSPSLSLSLSLSFPFLNFLPLGSSSILNSAGFWGVLSSREAVSRVWILD
ncbi:hypothetical protein ACJRO7_008241 [Eucalyptus globulus]|uniref:Uncharacterized protein n=1 Tax=Eucalyptus globulus TaxID=34317 RepID=A0ABD3IR67_EUCGL